MTTYVRLGMLLLVLHGCSESGNKPATEAENADGEPAGEQVAADSCARICPHIADLCGFASPDCVASCSAELTPAQGQCLLAADDCEALSECESAGPDDEGGDESAPCTGNACPSEADCKNVDCGGHGDCQVVAGAAACFCDQGYVLEERGSLTCVKSDGEGWGYRFDADSDSNRARAFLKQIEGEWFPERPAWTVNAADISMAGYFFQTDGPSGLAAYYAPDLSSVSIRKTYDRRVLPDYVVSKVSQPLTGGEFDGYRALELKSTKAGTATVATVLVQFDRVQSAGVAEHPVLTVAACASPYSEGVARPLLAECLKESSATAYVPSILGAAAYKTKTP